MPENILLFAVLALFAEIIGTVSGFGSSLLFVPIASFFFDFKSVLGITAVFHVFSNVSKIFLFKEGVDKRIALKLGIPAVLAVLLGAALTSFFPSNQMQLGMNVVLMFLALYLVLNFNKSVAQTNQNLYLGGALSGFLAGLVGTGGAIRGITLAAFHLQKQVFIATSALIDLGVDAGRAVVYLSQGYFKLSYLAMIPALILVSVVGSWIGKRVLQYTSEHVFRYLVLGIIVLTCIIEIVRFLHSA